VKKNIFGNYLRNLRQQNGTSVRDLAEQLDLSVSFLNLIELGQRGPSKKTIKKLSDYFKVNIDFWDDLLEKHKILNGDQDENHVSDDLPESIKDLVNRLLKVDRSLLKDLVSNFMHQVEDHLIQMIEKYTLTDLREKFTKEFAFSNVFEDNQRNIIAEGFLKLPEDQQIFFILQRTNEVLTLKLLQSTRNKIELFEKWIGPHSLSYICELDIPQVSEPQKGVFFVWFSPNVMLANQLGFIVEKKLEHDSVLFNSTQLAWFVQQNYPENEMDIV
jgi:transcriptional regulator with XRE-family HTH domain